MLFCITLSHLVLSCVDMCYVVLSVVILCYLLLSCAIWCHLVLLSCLILCYYLVSSCAIWCHLVLSGVILCYLVLLHFLGGRPSLYGKGPSLARLDCSPGLILIHYTPALKLLFFQLC